eukprot:SM000047S16830  [mRNA]  locus=s47:175769:179279:- [translate_table: standard]
MAPAAFLIQPPFVRPYTSEDIPVTYGMQNKTSNSPEQVSCLRRPRIRSPRGFGWWRPSFWMPWHVAVQSPSPFVTPLVASRVSQVLVSPADPTGRFDVIRWVLPVTGTLPGTLLYDTVYPPDKTTFYYRMKGPVSMSRYFTFTTPPGPGQPVKLGLIADVGQTTNSSSTYDKTIAGEPDVVLFAADLWYADNYGPPCAKFNGSNVPSGPNTLVARDRWQPTAFTAGNHELETVPQWNASATPFMAYRNRIPRFRQTPAPFVYSFDAGLVHVIASYEAFTKYTPQYNWARQALAAINQTVTPFVVVFLHNPWYNTDVSHYLEGFLYAAKVDLLVAGHVHAYERTKPVYRVAVDECGPAYVTVGDGGNDEAVAGPFYNAMDGSPPQYTHTRGYYFGHAELNVLYATYAEFCWYRNIDGRHVGDYFSLTPKYLTPSC